MSEQASPGTHLGRTAFEVQQRLTAASQICPVCQVVSASLRQHVDMLFYELVNDAATREAIRNAGGFCRYHARLIASQADALGGSMSSLASSSPRADYRYQDEPRGAQQDARLETSALFAGGALSALQGRSSDV